MKTTILVKKNNELKSRVDREFDPRSRKTEDY